MAYGSEWRERGGLITPLARRTESGMGPDDLLCSRNARPQKALVGRAQSWIKPGHPEGKAEESTSLWPSCFAKLRLLLHDGAS